MMLLVGKMMNFIRDVPQPVQEWDKKVLSMSSLSTDMRWMRKILILSTYLNLFWANFDFFRLSIDMHPLKNVFENWLTIYSVKKFNSLKTKSKLRRQ
jgi:hypothetical protein